jgi:S-(hydroxymethyl)glutathione dehydrogenase / alcohol dehydrogenase
VVYPVKTLAAILVEQKKPLELAEVELPKLGYGQVLVEIKATRICGSQIGEIDGVKGPDKYLPHLLGHEAGGVVLEVGPEVKHVSSGDRVVCHWRPGAGIDAGGSVYKWGGKPVNAGPITTFQKISVISENRLTKVPPETDFELCCLLADTLTTGFGVVARDARLEIGESAVVIGVGGIGLGTVLGAHLAGACPIIAVDLHDHKLAKAQEFGATHTIHAGREDMAARVREILGGSADAVFDGTGNPAVIEGAWSITSPQGRVVLVGVMPTDRSLSFNTLPLHYGKRLIGSEGGASLPSKDIPKLTRILKGRNISVQKMISHRVQISEINKAVSDMRSGKSIHSLVEFYK